VLCNAVAYKWMNTGIRISFVVNVHIIILTPVRSPLLCKASLYGFLCVCDGIAPFRQLSAGLASDFLDCDAVTNIESFRVLITMRGTERLLGNGHAVDQALQPPLLPLDRVAASRAFSHSISGLTRSDETGSEMGELFEPLDNAPLAINLSNGNFGTI
jgi:hypothetical protein